MNLIVDIGNSLLKVAVMHLEQELYSTQYADVREFNTTELLAAYPQVERAIVASSGVSTAPIAAMLRELGLWVLEMTPLTPVPIGNHYQSPETLGVDRLAAAVGAVKVLGYDDCLIVDFGTAITIDLVRGGAFCGGNISPGVRSRVRALHDYTQRLPMCEPTDDILDVGQTTRQAIEQGVMQGITNEIEGYIKAFIDKNAKILLIFTGGDAIFFVNRIKNAIFAKCNLVLCGLNTILDYNASIENQFD